MIGAPRWGRPWEGWSSVYRGALAGVPGGSKTRHDNSGNGRFDFRYDYGGLIGSAVGQQWILGTANGGTRPGRDSGGGGGMTTMISDDDEIQSKPQRGNLMLQGC